MCVAIDGVLDWILALLTIHRWLTTNTYSITANLQNSLTPAKPFAACCVFTSCSLATASNSGNSSASHAEVLSSQTPVQN
jgi:hypothetical protein